MCEECTAETGGDSMSNVDTDHDVSQLYRNPNNTQKAILSVFNLSKAEARAYVAVEKHPNSTVEHLAEDVLNRDPNYITRPLRSLYEIGLVNRTERTFEKGGTGYVYSPIPPEEVEQYFHDRFEDWLADMCEEVDRLDSRVGLDAILREPLSESVS